MTDDKGNDRDNRGGGGVQGGVGQKTGFSNY